MLSKRDVASALNISEKTVQRLVSRGDLAAPQRVGGSLRWRRGDLDGFLGAAVEHRLDLSDEDVRAVLRGIHARREQIRHRAFPTVRLRAAAETEGLIEGVASAYGVTYSIGAGRRERIERGAFAASVEATPTVPLFLGHDVFDPIGSSQLRESHAGLMFEADVFESERGASVYRAAKAGALDCVSVGYIAEEVADENGVEVVKRGSVLEVSIVIKGANPGARIIKV